MKKSGNIANKIYPAAALAVFIGAWELIVALKHVPEYRLPAPSVIFTEFINSFGLLMHHAGITVLEALAGFVLGIALAVLVALAMSMVRPVKLALYPFMIISQTVPLVVIAPLLAIWFGFGIIPKIIMSVIVVFFPVAVSLTEGLASFDPDLVDMMSVMNATTLAGLPHRAHTRRAARVLCGHEDIGGVLCDGCGDIRMDGRDDGARYLSVARDEYVQDGGAVCEYICDCDIEPRAV